MCSRQKIDSYIFLVTIVTSVWEKIETGLHSPSCRYGHACTGWSDGFWLAGGANDSKQVDDKLVYQYVACMYFFPIDICFL